ncbi:MAG TPA: protein-disulfide reductase DsbD domain-containing protein [Terriglobia bacterium]|nr:protein-disulfide reductase DsbD domain-containing protein [Terriglobia bacterium]
MKVLMTVAPPFRPVLPEGGGFLRLILIVVSLSGIALAQAQESLPALSKGKAPVQRVVAMAPKPLRITPGGKATAELQFQVKPGFHINSNKPGSELLLPTVVKLSPPTDIGVGSLEYPAGQEQSFPFSPGDKLNVYTGDFAVSAVVAAAKKMPPGRFRVHGFLEYQACDDRACYPPNRLPISFDVQVAGKTTPLSRSRGRHNPPQSPHIHN